MSAVILPFCRKSFPAPVFAVPVHRRDRVIGSVSWYAAKLHLTLGQVLRVRDMADFCLSQGDSDARAIGEAKQFARRIANSTPPEAS